MTNLKKFLDTQIGEHGYIRIAKRDNVLLCEGKVKELRENQLWQLIGEEDAKIYRSFSGDSPDTGKRCITIQLYKW